MGNDLAGQAVSEPKEMLFLTANRALMVGGYWSPIETRRTM